MGTKRKRFGIMGYGPAGQRHYETILTLGGEVKWILDPPAGYKPCGDHPTAISGTLLSAVDYVVIASPTYLHLDQIIQCLSFPHVQIIVEKPAVLPWERIPDYHGDRVNIVLQYRYADIELPDPSKIVVTFIRDKDWWDSWKGQPELSGGIIPMLHIHYIDLALRLGCEYEGYIVPPGIASKQHRTLINKRGVGTELPGDQQSLLRMVYEDIHHGGGIKPRDIEYLTYVCNLLEAKRERANETWMPKGGPII